MSSTQAKRKTHPAHTLTLGQSPVCERPSAVSTTQTDSLHMWVLDKILDRVFFPASTALDCTERFVSYIYEAFSSVLGQAAPPQMESTQPGLQRREAPEGSLGICDVWASSASQSLKPMQSFTKKRIPLTMRIPSNIKYLQTVNLFTVWKLIIRQLIQLSSTGRINSIYLPVISNNSCLKEWNRAWLISSFYSS